MTAVEILWRVNALVALLLAYPGLRRSYRRRYVQHHGWCHGSLVCVLRDGLPPVGSDGHAHWCEPRPGRSW